jgi:hypothetical protein
VSSNVSSLRALRILLAGDDFMGELDSLLQKMQCTIVGRFDRPSDCLESAVRKAVDVAILEYVPFEGSDEFVEVAKEIVRRKIPTLILSSYGDVDYPSELAALPAIAPPFGEDAVFEALRAVSLATKVGLEDAALPRTGFVTRENDRRFDRAIHLLKYEPGADERIFQLGLSYKAALSDVTDWVRENQIELLVFPLTLPNFLALQIGEYSRRPKATTKAILVTGSTVLDSLKGFSLFHSAVPPAKFDRTIVANVISDNSTLIPGTIIGYIEDLLKNDPSFVKLIDTHHVYEILERWDIHDYIDAKNNPGLPFTALDVGYTPTSQLVDALLGHCRYDVEALRIYLNPGFFEQISREAAKRGRQLSSVGRKAVPQHLDTTTVLFLASNPKDTHPLRLDEEMREIDEGLRRSRYRDRFRFVQKWAVRTADLRRGLLDEQPAIVHFSGHGSPTDGLVCENSFGQAELVPPGALADLFALFKSHVECVVLNACYSESQASAIAEHIKYVIGMRHAIGDEAAVKFSVGFYDALGAGRSYEHAFKFGCNAIDLNGIPEDQTPQLKIKDVGH